jgi:hypothetical protein
MAKGRSAKQAEADWRGKQRLKKIRPKKKANPKRRPKAPRRAA